MKVSKEKSQESGVEAKELQSRVNDSANYESGPLRAQESPSTKIQSSSPNTPVDDQKISPLPARKATGPRTQAGKRRSGKNSIKHGIFSSALRLGEGDAKSYRSHLKGLTEFFDPNTKFESDLVDFLATNTWRQRLVLLAENAAIRKNIDHVLKIRAKDEEMTFEKWCATEQCRAETDRAGLLTKIDEPGVLEDCLKWLYRLQMRLTIHCLMPETDWIALARIYGARRPGRPLKEKDLFDIYLVAKIAWRSSAEERLELGFRSEADCVLKFAQELEKEIQRLESLPKKPKLPEMGLLACNLPDTPELDRLLRYQARLEHSIDRTLSQLERLKRMRLG